MRRAGRPADHGSHDPDWRSHVWHIDARKQFGAKTSFFSLARFAIFVTR